MNLIDIIILIVSVAGLIFFFFRRVKYSNQNAYYQKYNRLGELEKEIQTIISDNEEAENIIKNINADMDFDDNASDKLIKYRDDAGRLETLIKEQREIKSYLKKARPYITRSFNQ